MCYHPHLKFTFLQFKIIQYETHTYLLFLGLGAVVLNAQSIQQGDQHFYYERFNNAEHAFHQALKVEPDNGEAWFNLTKAYALQNKLNKAADTLL